MSSRLPISFSIYSHALHSFMEHRHNLVILLLKTLSWFVSVKTLVGNSWNNQVRKFEECLIKRQFAKLECRETIKDGVVAGQWHQACYHPQREGGKGKVWEKIAVECIEAPPWNKAAGRSRIMNSQTLLFPLPMCPTLAKHNKFRWEESLLI